MDMVKLWKPREKVEGSSNENWRRWLV